MRSLASSILTMLISSTVLTTMPLAPQVTLNLADHYERGQTIAISVTNHENHNITIDETGQCHRFFKVYNQYNAELTITNPSQLCTLDFRSITLAPDETKVIDTWNQNIHTYCPPTAQCFAPDTLPAGDGMYDIKIKISSPSEMELNKLITIGNAQPFTDVPAMHWAYMYINDLYTKNIIHGYGNGTFGPENSITNAEVVKIALNAAVHQGLYSNLLPPCFPNNCAPASLPTVHFRDVPQSHSLYPYIAFAVKLHIIEDGTYFSPDKAATRFDCLQRLLKAFQKQANLTSAPTSAFTDVSSPAMAPYTNFAQSEGIVSGINGKFYPNEPVRRGEIAKMTYNLINN